MSESAELLARYFRQQQELGMPPYVFSETARIPDMIAALGSGSLSLGNAQVRRPPEAPLVNEPTPQRGAPPVSTPAPYPVPSAAPTPPSRVEESPATSPKDVRPAMVELYRTSRTCAACALAATRTNFIFGSGNVNAPLMVIGEAPGAEEDQQGLPFVGPAGQLLTKMLAAVNLDRAKDVFMTDLLKCRPPQGRDPHDGEIAGCVLMLKRQIEIMRPRALLLLGRAPAQALLGRHDAIGQLRTKTLSYQEIPVVVTYHPVNLLRNESLKRGAWEDLQRLKNILQELHAYAA